MQHVSSTEGGLVGHVIRRLIHLGCYVLFPLSYYNAFPSLAAHLNCTPEQIVYVLFALVLVIEFIRIKMRLQFFGMRSYEKKQVSAAAWGLLGFGCVVLLSPSSSYSYALCWTGAVIDPLAGELKRKIPVFAVYSVSLVVACAIWIGCWFYFGCSLWAVCVCAPCAVACEYPSWRYLDDNFTILVGPLLLLCGGYYLL